MFFEVICPGKDRHGAAFWCGSAALIRREALLAAGGVAVATIAEDFHTTIRLQLLGWTTRYHTETVIQGMAPHSLAAYLLQRDRWARGNLAVLTTPESPLRARGLPARVRLSYFASLASYLAGPARALLLAILAATLWTGALPVRATWWQFGLLWAPAAALNQLAGSALSRGYMRPRESFHFELTCAEIHLRALRCIVRPGRATFRVTPKEGIDPGGLAVLRQLRLPVLLGAALVLGLIARLLHGLGWIPLPALPGMATWAIPPLAAVEGYRIVRSLAAHVRRRQIRTTYRFPCHSEANVKSLDNPVVADSPGQLIDISPAGARLQVPQAIPSGTVLRLRFQLPDAAGRYASVEQNGRVRTCRTDASGTTRIGVEFDQLNPAAEQAIIEYCYVAYPGQRLRHPQTRTEATVQTRQQPNDRLRRWRGPERREPAGATRLAA